ncbi:MAG TPA: AAA family ATPase [Verrucomicrobiae bacterium]|nr:AAA family ATPase [Verrucomicrobiae bacterium]
MVEDNEQIHAPRESDEWKFRLDIPTMEKRIVHYPDELREPVLWLATYLFSECGRDLDVLAENSRKLGVQMDKTTWGRIIKGQWNRNAQGVETKPLVNLQKLLRAIAALKSDARLKEMAGRVPFIKTSRGEVVFNFIDALRAPDRINKFGIIVGRTGTEKTATTKAYCRENNHLTCIHMDAPAKPSYSQFVTDLAVAYNGTRQMSWGRMLAHIYAAVNAKRTIIIENVQRLYVEKAEANQPVFNFLQKLQDETQCTIILTITPVFAETLTRKLANGYFEQFIGRAGGVGEFLRLPDFAEPEDVLLIAESFGLQDAEKHLDYLVAMSREPGLIRILFGTLQKAKVAAELKNQKLTIHHIRAARGED